MTTTVNIGVTPDDHTGDTFRNAFAIVNGHLTSTVNPHATTAGQVGAVALTALGAASGVATLDNNGHIPTAQLGGLGIGDLPALTTIVGTEVLPVADTSGNDSKVTINLLKAFVGSAGGGGSASIATSSVAGLVKPGADFVVAADGSLSLNAVTTPQLLAGPGLADGDLFDVYSTILSTSVRYTFAQVVAAVIAKLPAGTTGTTTSSSSGSGTGSTGTGTGTGTTGTGTSTSTLPVITWSVTPAYGPGKFGQALTAGKGTVPLITVANSSGGADLVVNTILNFGSSNAYPYRDVYTVTINNLAYGINISDFFDSRNGASTSHTFQTPFDGQPHYLQIVLTSTASTGHFKLLYDGNTLVDTDVAAFGAGATATLLMDRTGFAADAYFDNVEVLNSAAGLSTTMPTAPAVRTAITNVIYAFDGSSVGA